jgi:predicted RND superfamily exporter protein
MGVMGWIGVTLNMATMLLGTIALGLAVDDTIHFFHNFRRYYAESRDASEATRQTMLTTGRALLFTTLVLVTGFWLYNFASVLSMVNFGRLVGITLIVALLADVLLAPAMLELYTRTARGRRTAERWGASPGLLSGRAGG